MKSLTSLIRRAPRRFSAVVAILAAAIVVPAAVFAWGPTRTTFTIEKPASYVTFNSITNNPNIGDERNFVGIREVGSSNVWYDDMTVKEGKEYYVRMYVHNNAASNLKLVAENVTAKFNLPTTTGKSIQVNGFLSASNAKPTEVYDHATFNGDKNFNLAYVKDSLKYENNAFGAAGAKLSESIFTSAGAKLGYDKLDGKIPGCFQYAGYVTFKVKPQFEQNNDFEFKKLVSKHGENKWVESYKAQPGEVVDYILSYQNSGAVRQDGVTFRDELPEGLTYVKDSARWNNSSKQNVKPVADLALTNGTGVNVGSYATKANAWMTFSAKVADKKDLKCGTNELVNTGRVTTGGYKKEDDATVVVEKECPPEPKQIRVCDLDTNKVITIDEKDFDAKKHSKDLNDCKDITVCDLGTKTVVTIKEHEYDSRKHSRNLDDCKEKEEIAVCDLDSNKVITIDEKDFDSKKHSKNLADCKNIQVCDRESGNVTTIKESEFDANKHSRNLNDCKEVPPVTPVTPETPSELPQTGAGDVAAIIGLGALIASTVYYVASRRALGL